VWTSCRRHVGVVWTWRELCIGCRGGESNLKVDMASAEREPIKGSGGGAPSKVQGQSPWSGDQGGRSPPEAERFLRIIRRKDRQYLPLYPSFESAEIYPKHCLESKYVYGTQKIHTQCVRERDRLNCRSRSASDVQNHTVRSHYL